MLLETIESLISTIESNIKLGSHSINSPNNVCVIAQYPGKDPVYVLGRQLPTQERPNIQIRIRDNEYLSGFNRITAIKNILSGYRSTNITIFQKGDILPLRQDLIIGTFEFTLNFEVNIYG